MNNLWIPWKPRIFLNRWTSINFPINTLLSWVGFWMLLATKWTAGARLPAGILWKFIFTISYTRQGDAKNYVFRNNGKNERLGGFEWKSYKLCITQLSFKPDRAIGCPGWVVPRFRPVPLGKHRYSIFKYAFIQNNYVFAINCNMLILLGAVETASLNILRNIYLLHVISQLALIYTNRRWNRSWRLCKI
jgi:hypothetical protein